MWMLNGIECILLNKKSLIEYASTNCCPRKKQILRSKIQTYFRMYEWYRLYIYAYVLLTNKQSNQKFMSLHQEITAHIWMSFTCDWFGDGNNRKNISIELHSQLWSEWKKRTRNLKNTNKIIEYKIPTTDIKGNELR